MNTYYLEHRDELLLKKKDINLITFCRKHHAKWHEQLGELNVANMIRNKGNKVE